MPAKRAAEATKSADECILQYGKTNKIIKWREQMQTIVAELYGIIGMFFTKNERYILRTVYYRNYPVESSSESEDSADKVELRNADQQLPEQDPAVLAAQAREARDATRAVKRERMLKSSERSKAKFREDDYIQRKWDIKLQYANERTMYPMMWKRMSVASQSRVREEDDYEQAYMTLDCVLLWTLIR